MSSRAFLAALSILLAATARSADAAKEPERPNILVIISDDQGSGDIGYNNPLVSTPHLDRFADSGARFTCFMAAPACSPSRAALLTGRNFMHAGVWGVGPRGYIHRDEVLMPEYFRRAGYATAHFGKWGEGWTPDQRPYLRGYDTAMLTASYDHQNPVLDSNGEMIRRPGWTVDVLADLTIDFIRRQTEKKQPWLAVTAYISPHDPWECPPEFAEPYRRAGLSEPLAAFFGMITQMDEATGRILSAIDDLGIEDRTIVVFLSDNGPSPAMSHKLNTPLGSPDWQQRNSLELRGEKATAWGNALRVPFLMRWPGRIPPGTRGQFTHIEDVLPTLLDLAGMPAAGSAWPHHLPLHGLSFKAVLLDPSKPSESRPLFTIPVAYDGAIPVWPQQIVEEPRTIRYEDIHACLNGPRYSFHSLPGGKAALYDLQDDPGETPDISSGHPEVLADMSSECRRRWDELVASGRAFTMPATLVGDPRFEGLVRCGPYLPPGVVPGNTAQKVAGKVTCPFEGAKGFVNAGDSATYAIEVASPGKYAITLEGAGIDACAPLSLRIAGKEAGAKGSEATKAGFGVFELKSGKHDLTILAGVPETTAAPAVLSEIKIQASN